MVWTASPNDESPDDSTADLTADLTAATAASGLQGFLFRGKTLPESKNIAFQELLAKIIAKDSELSILQEYRQRILL